MRKLALAIGLAALAAGATPALAGPGAAEASLTERNRAIVTDFVDLFCTQKKVREAFTKHVAPGYIQHNPVAADGRDTAIAALEPFFASQPNMKCEVKKIIVDGDMAAVHSKLTFGPNDRGSAVVDLLRIENGMIAEHWDVIQAVPEKSANDHPMF